MEYKKKTIIWEDNNEPPKDYIGAKKDGKFYEYSHSQRSWIESNIVGNTVENGDSSDDGNGSEPTSNPQSLTYANALDVVFDLKHSDYNNPDKITKIPDAFALCINGPFDMSYYNNFDAQTIDGVTFNYAFDGNTLQESFYGIIEADDMSYSTIASIQDRVCKILFLGKVDENIDISYIPKIRQMYFDYGALSVNDYISNEYAPALVVHNDNYYITYYYDGD